MRANAWAALSCIVATSLIALHEVRAAGVGISDVGHAPGDPAPSNTYIFFPYRPSTEFPLARRDLEFQLSRGYSVHRGDATPGLTQLDRRTLDKFGRTLSETASNPFGAPYPDLQLVHDYFGGSEDPYETNPNFPGFLPLGTIAYADSDRAHVDHYIFEPGLHDFTSGRYSSAFSYEKEDSSTGWWSPSSYLVLHDNSTSYPGPSLGGIQDTAGTAWTRPDATANWGTIHEIQHYFNDDDGLAMEELFSTAAEVLTGALPSAAAVNDVNYTWSFYDNWRTPRGSGVTHTTTNYAAWRLFSAYMLTNFRNQDLTATLPGLGTGGLADDVMYRWARTNPRTLAGLKPFLSNDECYTCSQKLAFNPGGSALSTADRLNVLMHNWRVANFVNNPILEPDADGYGMYGYPSQFGFSPTQDVGAWADNDTDSAAYNVGVFPAVVTARPNWMSRDTVISGTRSLDAVEYPLRLRPVGSEYWIIRSSAGIPAGKELVVRVASDSLYWRNPTYAASVGSCPSDAFGGFAWSGNVMASLVGYSAQSDTLWDDGGSAETVVGPFSVDIDSLAGEIELVLPGFGTEFEAAVLVLTSGFGPVGGFSGLLNYNEANATEFHEATRYRLNLALRDTSTADVNPRALVQSAATKDDPVWSPDGSEIVYSATGSPYTRLYRVPAAGGSPSLLVSASGHQRSPDWSPLGDYIVYTEDLNDTTTSLYRLRVEDPEVEPLTSDTTEVASPSFSPNGQRIAYARRTPGLTTWRLWAVNVDGTGDSAISSTVHANPIESVRWSGDGSAVYYVSGERLHGVTLAGSSSAQRDSVVAKVGSFDLPRGTSRLLLEEVGTTNYLCNGSTNPTPFRRLAFRDTTRTPRDTEMRFYRTNTSFYSPRYSPDNRFVAYRSDQNSVGGGDLFVGQVIWDQAPAFDEAPIDRETLEGQGVTIDMTATDPDGDAVIYSAAHMPSGASIVNGFFLWPNPTVAGSPHYITLRAGSAGGAVTSHVVRIDVVPRPVPVADLYLLTGRYTGAIAWTEPDQPLGVADSYEIRYHSGGTTMSELNFGSGSLVSYTEDPGTEGTEHCHELSLSGCTSYTFAIRTIRDGVPSFISNVASGSTACSGSSLVNCMFEGLYGGGGGGGSLRTGGTELASVGGPLLASEPTENTLLGGAQGVAGNDLMLLPGDAGPIEGNYQVRLRQSARNEVELDEVVLIAVDHDAELEAIAGSGEVLLGTSSAVSSVLGPGNSSVESGDAFASGDTLSVDLGTASDAILLAVSGPGTQPASGATGVEVQVPDGEGWRTVERIHPRRSAAARAIDVDGATDVRLVFGSTGRLESMKRFEVDSTVEPTPLSLASATHSGGPDVATAVGAVGGDQAVLARGEELALSFTATEVPAGKTRSLFLGARGAHRTTESAEARTSTSAAATMPVSYAFSLGAARPNPTTGRVTISYTLATATAARVQVYSVSGRLVRTLVDGLEDAGPHEVIWDGRTNAGVSAGPGVYFYRLEAGSFRSERKVVVINQ